MGLLIALLRGVNVSGQKKILMTDLRQLFADAGFKDIQTYIQSGNVIFSSPNTSNPATIRSLIEQAIEKQYGFHVDVNILRPQDIKKILANNPFLETGTDITKLSVTILKAVPEKDKVVLLATLDYPPDKFIYKDSLVYIQCPNGFGRTKLSNNFFESKLKVSATSRNWRTLLKLDELSSHASHSK